MKGERRGIWNGLMFAVLLTVLAFVCGACADTYTVCPDGGCNYTSIKAAIDAAQPGDTIIVRDGTHTKNVLVNVANLTLRSENGSAFTKVVAAVNTSDVFRITANSVTITGFTVRNATSESGIYLDTVHHCIISGNNVSSNYVGISLDFATNNYITGNNVYNSSGEGIWLSYSSNNTITDNHASINLRGCTIWYSSNNTITDNCAYNNSDIGIFIRSSTNNTIMMNHENNKFGIYLIYSNNTEINGDTVFNNTWDGILISDSRNNTIAGNHAYDNCRYGIYLSHSNNNIICSNKASNNSWSGIVIGYSDNNTVINNYACNNSISGIYLDGSDNVIYNNYFDNTNNAVDEGHNTWNITRTPGTNIVGGSWLGGNYWSDYTGVDTNDDGLGDMPIPYNLSGDIQHGGDWLPLLQPPSFDTGTGTYPSISGTHNGTITPSRNLTVSQVYTYSCPGTGGHTETIALYNNSELLANGTWNGYVGDWHNITITPRVTLEKDHVYRYVITTGSYPQMHHRTAVQTDAGWLNCTAFIDANGRLQEAWVPAIRLIGSAANETPAGLLVQPNDLTYLGAFRLPGGDTPPQTLAYGGNAMSFNPDGDSSNTDQFPGSLFVMGHDRQAWGTLPDGNQVAELTIPVPVNSSNLDDLPYATFIQGFHDVATGYFHDLDEVPKVGMQYLNHSDTGPKIHLCWGRHLQQLEDDIPSHAWVNATLATPDLQGVWFIGNQNPNSVNGYMFDIPGSWADAHAQGRYLATGRVHGGGLGGMGPALFAYRPWLAGGAAPVNGTHLVETTLLLYENAYNTEEITRCMAGYQHPDEWEGGAWITTPSGKSTVLFAGTKSSGTKYWYGYLNPAGPQYPCVDTAVTDFVTCRLANGTPCPPEDFASCCDEDSGNCSSLRGWWSTRFDAQLILYDPADLARVAAGTMNSWEPQPYATIDIDDRLYFNPPEWDEINLGAGDQRRYRIGDATYDRENGFLYVLELYGDGAKPIVHVWRVQ